MPTSQPILRGTRVLEFGGLGPSAFGAMLLADLGADVVRVQRLQSGTAAAGPTQPDQSPLLRGRTFVQLDLASADDLNVARRLVAAADVLIDPFRPGALSRRGLGPKDCQQLNERLVYIQVTGWGQDGPLSALAGHDINYLALSGALYMIGPAERPTPPLNLIADYGGGGMLMVIAVLAALQQRERAGKGSTMDIAVIDAVALLMAGHHGLRATGTWSDDREAHILNGAAPFYNTYETSDGRHVAVGAMESQFYRRLITALGLAEDERFASQHDQSRWPEMRQEIARRFSTRPRDEWAQVFSTVDACVTPVLSPAEAIRHEHSAARGNYLMVDGVAHPAPALHQNGGTAEWPAPSYESSAEAVLDSWGS